VNLLRSELTTLPERIKSLPVDERGYPVPWFVEWLDGKPEFRLMDGRKWMKAVRENLCWVCGHRLGSYLCFVLGPMCGISRTTSEPPCHLECARWSAVNCPFLARPHMVRRGQEELEEHGVKSMGGIALKRNPGVCLLWITHNFKIWRPDGGGYLIRVGELLEVEWYSEGRRATLAEVEESVRTGLPALEEIARAQEGALPELYRQRDKLAALYPAAV
jgi:hypothetical protein